MNLENNWWGNRNVAIILALLSLLLIIGIFLRITEIQGANFKLTFNVYALISFFAAAVDIVNIILVLVKKRYTAITNWFILFLLGATGMALAEGLQRSSSKVTGALFWQNIYFIFMVLLPPVFYLFTISYVYAGKKKFVLLSPVLIFTWSVLAFIAGNGGNQIYLNILGHIHDTPWGYISDQGPLYIIVIIWCALFYIFGTGLLIQFFKKNPSVLIKKQVRIFLLAFLMPVIVGLVTSVFIPPLFPNLIPPLTTLFGAISVVLIYYAIRRYQLFVLDPDIVAQNILDTLNEAVIITRPNMVIETVNNEALRMISIEKSQYGHIKLSHFFNRELWNVIITKINQSVGGNIEPIYKSLVKSHNDIEIPVRIAITPHREDGIVTAYIFVLTDISVLSKALDDLQTSNQEISNKNTKLIHLENQLREEKANVEHIVEIRTKALIEAQEKLKAADQLKSEFIMLTSHNLRTPISIASGSLELLQEPASKDTFNLAIEGLKDGLNRLRELVEDLLTISSIEYGDQFKLNPVTLDQIVNPLIQEVSDLAKVKHNKLILNLQDMDTKIMANSTLLKGAIHNILNNACKFTDNGSVTFSTKKKNNKIILSTSDTGIGIESSQIPQLFNKFHRASSALTSDYEGKGVGLYLSKLIIDEHHGKINVVSEPGKGSTFTIELPCQS